jgi:hypothetical protein
MDRIPRSRREAIALAKIQKARERRKNKQIVFLQKLAKRRGFALDLHPCQEGFKQIVDKVAKAGHGFFYTSKACAGCAPGEAFLRNNMKKDGTLQEFPEKILGCRKLQEELLYSKQEIKENDIIIAAGPLQEQERE